MKKLQKIAELFAVFFKIGAVTFGGGLAMLPILERELVDKRGWTTKDQLLDYFAIGQATPGIIAVNVATFIGYTQAGILGGCIATLGVVTPSLIIISAIALVFENFTGNHYVQKALAGINIAVAAMLCKIVWGFRKKATDTVLSSLLCAAAFLAIVVCKIPTAAVIISTIGIGIVIHLVRTRCGKEKSDGGNQ